MFRGLCCVGDAMKKLPGRRQVLKGAAAACAALLLPGKEEVADSALRVAGEDVEIQIAPVSRHTVRLTVVPVKRASENGQPMNRSEEHTSELQSRENLVCRLL